MTVQFEPQRLAFLHRQHAGVVIDHRKGKMLFLVSDTTHGDGDPPTRVHVQRLHKLRGEVIPADQPACDQLILRDLSQPQPLLHLDGEVRNRERKLPDVEPQRHSQHVEFDERADDLP
ncbi:hypothetical protein GCM10022267_90120 [Lentzea roselyniae]|uniref:DDE superfamily endonuclease n=1 Tax=Lentzea roselyniae TaxID=531940 RepID=A0ABP7CF59_9PSEU